MEPAGARPRRAMFGGERKGSRAVQLLSKVCGMSDDRITNNTEEELDSAKPGAARVEAQRNRDAHWQQSRNAAVSGVGDWKKVSDQVTALFVAGSALIVLGSI